MAKKKDKKDEIEKIFLMEDKAKEYLAKFNKARSFNSDRFNAYAELMAFYQGNQHLLKQFKTDKPWVINMNTPYASVAVDNRVSSLLASDYIGELLPTSIEDVESIEALQKLYEKEWQRLDLDNKTRESIRTSAIVRESYIHIILDKSKLKSGKFNKLGVLNAYHLEPGQISIDPTARTLKDARYVCVSQRLSKNKAKSLYPNLDYDTIKSTMSEVDRGEVYLDNDYTTEQEDVYNRVIIYEINSKDKIEKTVLLEGIIAEDTVVMDGLTRIPIAQMRWKKAAQSCYGLSLMDEVLALQKAICSIESAITNTAIAYAAPSMMVRKGCGVDPIMVSVANGAPGVVYAVDGDLDNAMRPVIPPKIEKSILDIKTDYEIKIDKITGNSNQFLGDIGTAGNTASGANIAVERAKIIEIDVLNNISEFIEDLTHILVEYLIQIYSGETVNVFDGKGADGKTFNFTDIEMPEETKLKDLQYKYYIELNTKTPFSKERQKELLLEIFTLERQYDTPIKSVTVLDVIKNSDLENKDEIISRFNELNKQDSETKANAIVQLIQTCMTTEIPEELMNQGVSEIIGGYAKTPALDQITSMAEQVVQQEMAMVEQQLNEQEQMQAPIPMEQPMVEDIAMEQPIMDIPEDELMF